MSINGCRGFLNIIQLPSSVNVLRSRPEEEASRGWILSLTGGWVARMFDGATIARSGKSSVTVILLHVSAALNITSNVQDIGFQIPLLMERFDRIKFSIHYSQTDNVTKYQLADDLAQDALLIQLNLDRWMMQLNNSNDSSRFYIPRTARTIESPKVDDLGNLFPISFDFPNWDIASALIYRDMVLIFLNNFLLGLIEYAYQYNIKTPSLSFSAENYPTRKSIEAADRICQSIEYFFEDHKQLIMRMVILAPFESARALYAHLAKTGMGIDLLGCSNQEEVYVL